MKTSRYAIKKCRACYSKKLLNIISFGNQVSSILLGKNIKVSEYKGNESQPLNIKCKMFNVYSAYYPVGQGMRNIGKAIERIKNIVN